MVLSVPQLQNLTLQLVLEKTEQGQSRASVLGLSDCVVEAATDEEAIEKVQKAVIERLAHARVIEVEIPLSQPSQTRKSWMKYAGVFKDDPDFAEIAERLRAERREEDDSAE